MSSTGYVGELLVRKRGGSKAIRGRNIQYSLANSDQKPARQGYSLKKGETKENPFSVRLSAHFFLNKTVTYKMVFGVPKLMLQLYFQEEYF